MGIYEKIKEKFLHAKIEEVNIAKFQEESITNNMKRKMNNSEFTELNEIYCNRVSGILKRIVQIKSKNLNY